VAGRAEELALAGYRHDPSGTVHAVVWCRSRG